MKRYLLLLTIIVGLFKINAQVKLHLDSNLKAHYIKKYQFSESLLCIPFYCDPFKSKLYKKNDTIGLCGKFVFVDTEFKVKIMPIFDLPCAFEPRFGEGLCAVNIKNEILFIDTLGQIKLKTGLAACSPQTNRVLPFKNGKSKVYKGSNTLKKYHTTYYIDKNGDKIKEEFFVKVVLNPKILIAAIPKREDIIKDTNTYYVKNEFIHAKNRLGNFYPAEPGQVQFYKNKNPGSNLFLIQFACGDYQLENMNENDTPFCGKYLFVDSFFNVKISKGFEIPCSFEPEFSEGLCAVSLNNEIVYIDTTGKVKINTGLKACSVESNKVTTFQNGIATLFQGDPKIKGIYQTIAINALGERVKLLEFDDLAMAIEKFQLFENLTETECTNNFVGKGKSNGYWFLIEKSGKVRKKLILK